MWQKGRFTFASIRNTEFIFVLLAEAMVKKIITKKFKKLIRKFKAEL